MYMDVREQNLELFQNGRGQCIRILSSSGARTNSSCWPAACHPAMS